MMSTTHFDTVAYTHCLSLSRTAAFSVSRAEGTIKVVFCVMFPYIIYTSVYTVTRTVRVL